MNRSASLHNNLENWRILAFVAVIGLVFIVFTYRLFTLQVMEGDDWRAQAVDNSTTEINIPAQRGVVYDRNGVVLARNVASYNIVVIAADLPDDGDDEDDDGAIQQIYRELSTLIDMPVSRGSIETTPYVPCVSDHGIAQIVEYAFTSRPYEEVLIKCDIDETLARIIEEKSVDWPGISVQIQPIREYPTSDITSAFVGFLGPIPAAQEPEYLAKGFVPNRDKVGYAGLELSFQDLLAGVNGKRVVQVDVGGERGHDLNPPIDPVNGYNLNLTIDTRLQMAAQNILARSLDRWNAISLPIQQMSSGVVIAMNPQTGEILAMVSWPTYENQRMARLIPAYYYEQLVEDPTNPLLNHAVGDRLPVGSVFKIVTGTGALNEGVVEPDQIIETPGKLVVTEKFYENDVGLQRDFVDHIYDENPGGFGQLDFIRGLAYSSNVYFYKLGGGFQEEVPEGLGICRLGTYARALGYGDEAPGLGLPDEEGGLVPDPEWKRLTHSEGWSTGDTYIASVGQGYVLGTPMQVLLSAATLANDGKLVQPTLIRDVTDDEGNIVPVWLDQNGDAFVPQQVQAGDKELSKHEPVRQISPFIPHIVHDITVDPVIEEFEETTLRGCESKGTFKTVEPWVIETLQAGMRRAVTDSPLGTLSTVFEGSTLSVAGKTGTAEYCDQYARDLNRCGYGKWPSHAWTVAYAPYENPEIAVVAFVYNGNEGSTVAGPVVREVLEQYFELKNNAGWTP